MLEKAHHPKRRQTLFRRGRIMEKYNHLLKNEVMGIISQAIEEDLGGYGDITSKYLIDGKSTSKANIICKEKDGAVLCGIDIARYVFEYIEPAVEFKTNFRDGMKVSFMDKVCEIKAKTISILSGERLALNFLQRLSAIATKTEMFSSVCSKYGVRVCETRKTTPNLRKLEKYAVLCGGGHNHRFGLFDGILIKDNHITAAQGVSQAISRIRKHMPHNLRIEVEVADLLQLDEAIRSRADIIMLDNMDIDTIRQAVDTIKKANRDILVEVSGNVSYDRLEDLCTSKVDIISVGELTHSIKAIDFSLELLH
jgi:nicotinate-nucleotide pyrophosphorylase (carboxylating)